MAGAVLCLSYSLSEAAADAKRASVEGNRQTSALFALTDTVCRVQGAAQRLVREEDPDVMEKLIEQDRSLTKTALERIREAGAETGDVASAFSALLAGNRDSAELVLHGDYALAEEALLERSGPAFDRLIGSIGELQAAVHRTAEASVSAAEARGKRAQFTIWGADGDRDRGALLFCGYGVAQGERQSARRGESVEPGRQRHCGRGRGDHFVVAGARPRGIGAGCFARRNLGIERGGRFDGPP